MRGGCDVCDAEVNTKDGDVLGIAYFSIIVLHGGLCPHVKVETILNLVVMERGSFHLVVVIEQVRRVRRISLFIWEDELCGDSTVDSGECAVVVVDGDGSCVVASEPRRELGFRGILVFFPAFHDAFDGFCSAISCGLHEISRE